MNGNSLVLMAWRNLWRNRRRTLLTLSSIVFGVFLAVLMMAMQDRNWSDMIDLAARMGGGHVTVQHSDYQDTPILGNHVQGTAAVEELARSHGGVERTVVRITGHALLSTAGESYGTGFIAFDPTVEDASTLSILEAVEEGAAFDDPDDGGILLGVRLADNLGVKLGGKVVYTMTDRNGDIVSGLARLRGVVTTGAPSIDAVLCLLPIGAVREVLGFSEDEATQVAVFVEDQRRAEEVATWLDARVGEQRTALPWNRSQPELAGFIALKIGGAYFLQIVIAVLVAAGIFNTLFVSVMERLREFGIMVAIGWSPGQLFRLVMLESLWLAIVGLIGAAAVTWLPYRFLAQTGIDVSAILGDENMDLAGVAMPSVLKVGIFPETVLLIAGAALLATLASGIYPAWRAGHVEPVETIRVG